MSDFVNTKHEVIVKCSDYLPKESGDYETNLGVLHFVRRAYSTRASNYVELKWYKKVIICDICTYNLIKPQWWKEKEEPPISVSSSPSQ